MKTIVVLVCVILAITGFAAFWFYKVPEISYGLDFGSVLDAIALLIVGGLIEYAYLKQSSAKQADTDLLLDVVAEAKNALAGLVKTAEACENVRPLTIKEQIALTCAERELSNAVHSIETGLRHCSASLDKINFEKLKDARSELKDSLTDSPFPGPYTHTSRIRIRAATKVMRDELTRIGFAINRR
jgi:hypothetical protein